MPFVFFGHSEKASAGGRLNFLEAETARVAWAAPEPFKFSPSAISSTKSSGYFESVWEKVSSLFETTLAVKKAATPNEAAVTADESFLPPNLPKLKELAPSLKEASTVSSKKGKKKTLNAAAGVCDSNFTDDFNDGIMDAKWSLYQASATPSAVYERGGVLEIVGATHPTNNTYAGYQSNCSYPIVGTTITAQIVQPTTANGGGGNYAFIGFQGTSYRILLAYNYIYYLNTPFTYDPSRDKWIRIRDDVATKTIYFESSADGANWEVRETYPRGDWTPSYAFPVALWNGTVGGYSSVDTVKFDNFSYININNPALSNNSASFVGVDSTTQGNWSNNYGSQGYQIIGDASNLPGWAQFSTNGNSVVWSASTAGDVRTLRKASNPNDRIASTWYSMPLYTLDSRFEMAFNFTDGQTHQLALYCLDWDNYGRVDEFEIVDAANGAVLDRRTIDAFNGGKYVVWQVKGEITVRVRNGTIGSANAVVGGVFIGGASSPPPPTPTPTPTPPPGMTNTSRARLSPKNATGGTNLYSRNFGWGTGLAGLAGRGLNAGFGISYNSLVWVKSGSDIVFNPNKDNVTPGFRFGFPVIEPAYADPMTGKNTYLVVSPSGSRTEFRQIDGSTTTFEAADSSYSQLRVINPNLIVIGATDGTQSVYELKNGAYRCTQIIDRNGNFITVNTDASGLLQSVTDTLGRIINVTYDGGGQPLTVTQQWQNATHTYATFTYATQIINTNFSGLNIVGTTNGASVKVLQKITYADGSFAQFDYNSYGQVWKVSNYAADGHKLSHAATNLDAVAAQAQTDCPRFTELRNWAENFNLNAGNQAQETVIPIVYQENQTFTLPDSSSGVGTLLQVTAPDGTISKTYVGSSGWMEALPIVTEDWANEGGAFNRKRWTWTAYTQDNPALSYILNPRVVESKIGDATNVKRTTIEYHTQPGNAAASLYGLVKDVIQYNANGTSQMKRTHTEYNLDPNTYLYRRIIGLPAEMTLYDENNSLLAKVTNRYDEGNFSGANQSIAPVQHDNTNYGAGFIIGRGNLTSTTRWDVTAPTNASLAVTSQIRYDTAGSPVAQIDPLNRTVSINYADSFDDNVNRNAYAFPTVLTDPAGNSSTVKYRYDIGANVYAASPAPAGNAAGKTTSRIYDALGRLERETIVNTGAYTRYEYPASGIQSKVFSTITDVNGNGADAADEVLSESFVDGAGRIRFSRTELPNSAGGWSASLTEYDVMGRVKRASVPTEVNASWQPAGDDAARGFLWTQNEYDWKGRTTRIINTDGTDKLISYEGCGCAGGQVSTVSSEQLAEGRRRQKVYDDILGRSYKSETLNWDGSVYSTTRTTFNGRDQATLVRQYAGAETSGTFQDTLMTYDGHGRLKTQHRPEQNANTATVYNYNADDSVQSVTDARGAVTNYVYNSRRLVEQISYSVPTGSNIPVTPTVSLSYDALGNRTQMTDGLGSVTYEYSQLSQLVAETRRFNDILPNAPLASNGFRLQYGYSLAGQMQSLTDPYGQQFNYSFDKVGRLTSVTGVTAFAGISTYANNPGYNARGTLTSLQYGNGVQMAMTAFNAKLQATTFEVKKGADSYIKKQYQFYADGALKFIDDQLDHSFDRSYQYDFAGRTVEAKAGVAARGGASTQQYKLDQPYTMQYAYDPFGHLTNKTGYYYSSPDTNSYSYDTHNRNPAWSYDADGNTTADEDAVYEIDAAGRAVKTGARDYDHPEQFASYTADYFNGDGQLEKRVRNAGSTTPPPTTDYYIRSTVLNKVISEADAAGKKLKTFVPANGTTLATQAIYTYNGTTEVLTFNHTDASATAAQETAASGALVGNTTYNRTAEYTPLGRNIADAGLYITLNTGEPVESGGGGSGVNLFGVGGGYRPGRATYKIDGLTVPQVMFMEVINSGAIGGAFGLLEMSARMSVPKLSHYSVGDKNYGDNFGEAWGQAAETHGTLTRNWIVNDNWSLNLSLIPAANKTQQQKGSFTLVFHNEVKKEGELLRSRLKDIIFDAKAQSDECTEAFKAVGAVPIKDQLAGGNLFIVTESVFMDPNEDNYWADKEFGDLIREAAQGSRSRLGGFLWRSGPITAGDVTYPEVYKGKRYIGLTTSGMKNQPDWLSVIIIHALVHSGGVPPGPQPEGGTDLDYLGEKYDRIITACQRNKPKVTNKMTQGGN